jgi:opine dehydrogenase
MRVAVIGGGNGSYAAAADLAEQGHEVSLWRRDVAALDVLRKQGGLHLKDSRRERVVPITRLCAKPAEALEGAALVVAPVPAFAQESLAEAICPHLQDDQVVLLPPGSFGSYVMARAAATFGRRPAFAESGTLPWLARKHGPGTIAITTRATRLPTGVFPAHRSESAFAVIRTAFPSIEKAEDALSGALMNAGPIIHPPLIVMNAGPLEHFSRWDIHNEGTQPSIRRITNVLDEERIALRRALGYAAPHFPLADHYRESPEAEEWMYGNLGHERLVDSGDWREHISLRDHRYMREDVAVGLAFLVSVADWAGTPCPVARGLLAIGAAISGDFSPEGCRTMKGLGLAGLDRAAMGRLLQRGFDA